MIPRGVFRSRLFLLAFKFILDQFDADTGSTKVLMVTAKCCDDQSVCLPATPVMLNAQFTMLPGKSNNHVRAIDVKLGSGPSDKPFDDIEMTTQLRRTAGGFKSYN